jgi:orotate phosphoribosyltransferase
MNTSLNKLLCHAIKSELLYRGITEDMYAEIGGMETGAIPLVKAFALYQGKDCFYVRKERKDYGTQKVIEGVFSGQSYLLMDDVVTTGYNMWKVEETVGEAKARFCIIDRRKDEVGRYRQDEIISLFKEKDFD